MSYSDSFPSVSPSWQCNFSANGGRIDPRATFSRSDTPPTYAAPSAVHFWSNEKHLSSDNLFLHSSTFDNAAWLTNGITKTAGQSDPSGGSNAYKLLENTSSAYHNVYQASSGNESWALTVYAKQNTGTRYLALRIYGAAVNNYETAVFDLAGSAPSVASGSSSGYTNVAATQTASGNGFYKCTLKATGSIAEASIHISQNSTATGLDQYGVAGYTGDGTSSIDIAFASLSSVGSTEYVPTTTQIARSYAPTLKSVATAGQPRFEYDPTDGESMGCLIEGQSQNLLTYSSDLSNAAFTPNNVSVTTEAIAPDGTLSAVSVREDGSTDQHRINQAWVHAGGYFTISVYAKAIGSNRRLLIREGFVTGSYASFDLNTGTVTSQGAGGTGAIESVGNGWYRCSMASNIGANTLLAMFYLLPSTGTTSSDATYTGDYYSGLLLAMAQAENQVWASSWISTSGSAVTRAADSLSVATADIGYTGGPVSLQIDFNAKSVLGSTRRIAAIQNTRSLLTPYISGGGDVKTFGDVDFVTSIDTSIKTDITANTDYSVALRWDTNDYRGVLNGTLGNADTSCPLPDFEGATLYVGGESASGVELDGTIKRIALYNEALSDTNLQALTS